MTRQQARGILAVFRPGTADEADPYFAEALALMQSDAALREWFERQSKTDGVLRAKLRQIAIPPHLEAKLLATATMPASVTWYLRPVVWAAAAAAVGLIILGDRWLERRDTITTDGNRPAVGAAPAAPIDFIAYRTKMARIAAGNYKVSFESRDLGKIRDYLATHNGHTNYQFTASLEKLPAQGTAVLSWRKTGVSLICLEAPDRRTLYLFITNRANVPEAPGTSSPQFAEVERLGSASWSSGDKTYILMIKGDRGALQGYF